MPIHVFHPCWLSVVVTQWIILGIKYSCLKLYYLTVINLCHISFLIYNALQKGAILADGSSFVSSIYFLQDQSMILFIMT